MQLSVVLRGLLRSSRQRGMLIRLLKKVQSHPLRGGVKEELKPDVKPSVTLDKSKGLDVHVPVTSGNVIDFNSLQGLINIHFHFHNK